MIPFKLNKEECVLVSGSFSREDIMGLNENSTLLSAKVSRMKSTVVNLYSKGFNTFIFTSNGLFDLILANIINDLNNKGLTIDIVFIKEHSGVNYSDNKLTNPESFAHISCCFSETKEDFSEEEFSAFLNENAGCVLCPSKVKSRVAYAIPPGEIHYSRMDSLPN